MMPILSGCMLAIAVTFATITSAEACSRKVSSIAAETFVPEARINQKLLDSAVRAEVNYHRCRAGLPPLNSAGLSLVKQAQMHSRWMARTQQLSHLSNKPGAATLKQRVQASGVTANFGAENIGMIHRYQIDERRIRVLSSSRCKFATRSGKVLPRHSYASLARFAVHRWMKSPDHRKNILHPKVSRVSTAAAFDPKAKYCGQYWMTQKFVG